MDKCIACEKKVLLSTYVGKACLCKNCASKVKVFEWKNRDVSTMEELIANKNTALQLATESDFSGEVISEIEKYFDTYINAGFITAINGKAGQILRIFSDYCIIDTKNDDKRSDLADLFYYFTDDDDDEEDDRTIFEKEKDSIVRGLLSGKLVQTGIGLAASAVIETQGKEKADERKSREIHKRREKVIVVGEDKINLKDYGHVDTYIIKSASKGYLRFIPKGVASNDYYACVYFFFNANALERKKIKAQMDSVRDMLNEMIMSINKEQETSVENNVSVVANSEKDVFEKIRKYKGLLDEGIITEDEFNKMKKALLGL